MQCRARLLAVVAMLALACCYAHGAANMHDGRHRRAGRRLLPPLSHRNQPDVEAGTAPKPPSTPVNTDLEDLLRVLTQRQRLNPRPRLLPFM